MVADWFVSFYGESAVSWQRKHSTRPPHLPSFAAAAISAAVPHSSVPRFLLLTPPPASYCFHPPIPPPWPPCFQSRDCGVCPCSSESMAVPAPGPRPLLSCVVVLNPPPPRPCCCFCCCCCSADVVGPAPTQPNLWQCTAAGLGPCPSGRADHSWAHFCE